MEQEKKDAIKAKMEEHNRIALEERIRKIRERWNNLQRFNNPDDIPDLPRADKKEWEEFYVPRLIAAGAIAKKDLIDGQVYIGQHRNTDVARWNRETNRFDHMRYKFGWVKDDCNHFEDDDGFALFVPIRLGTENDWNERIKG